MHASILELIDHELMNKLQNLSPSQRGWLAREICGLAVRQSGVIDPLVDRAFDATGRTDESMPTLRKEVQVLIDQLDDIYFSLQESYEAGQASLTDVYVAFNKARAVNAVYFALDDNSIENLGEVIYEVLAIISDHAVVRQLVEDALSNENGAYR